MRDVIHDGPVWVWAVSAAGLIAVIAAEIALTGRSGSRTMRPGAAGAGTARGAIGWVGVYVSLAALVGLAIGITAGWVTAGCGPRSAWSRAGRTAGYCGMPG